VSGYCATCNNTGFIDCHCGGDLCVCDNNGEEPCPACDGSFADDDGDFDDGFDAGEWNNEPAPKVVNVGDELHQVLGEALAAADGSKSRERGGEK
jgi:hypothetical protein